MGVNCMLLLVKLRAESRTFTKINTPLWLFSHVFLNYANGTKLREAPHMVLKIL